MSVHWLNSIARTPGGVLTFEDATVVAAAVATAAASIIAAPGLGGVAGAGLACPHGGDRRRRCPQLHHSRRVLAGWLRSLPVFTMTIIVNPTSPDRPRPRVPFGWRSSDEKISPELVGELVEAERSELSGEGWLSGVGVAPCWAARPPGGSQASDLLHFG
jgi:hypothetical protein